MSARDIYHDQVRTALEKDGWAVTHDPFRLKWRDKKMYIDLGAERLLAAEKGTQKIAVEVKSFVALRNWKTFTTLSVSLLSIVRLLPSKSLIVSCIWQFVK